MSNIKQTPPSAKSLPDKKALLAGIDTLLLESGASPSSPEFRNELLVWFKERYKLTRAICEELLFADGDGTKCAKRLSGFQDTLIQAIYDFAVSKVFDGENRSSGERLAIAAVGGYGRGTLAPGSDIDLLFHAAVQADRLVRAGGGICSLFSLGHGLQGRPRHAQS